MKVIRSKNIYTKKKGKLKLVFFLLIAAVLLVGAGWFIAGPMMDMLANSVVSQPTTSIGSSEVAQSAPITSSEGPSSLPEVTSGQTSADWLVEDGFAQLPVEQLKSPQGITEFLNALQTQNGTAPKILIVDVKAAGGTLAYATVFPGAESASSPDLTLDQMAANVKTIQGAGVKLIARIHCFDDYLAGKFVEGSKVALAGSPGYTWLDDSQSSGGHGWLNAYSTTAQDYLIAILKEVSGAGFDGILLDSVQLPVGYGLKKADYGANATQMTAEQTLSGFINKAIAAVPQTPVLLNTTARAVVDGEVTPYGGVSPFTYQLSGLAGYTVTLNTPQYPRKQAPVTLTEEQKSTYLAAIDALTTQLPVIPLIQE